MSEVLGDFIRALRAADVRVSTSESIDAGNVIDLVGFNERETLRDALSQVLAKSDDEKQAFLKTFDTFFAFDQFKEKPASVNEPAANENDERQQDEADGGEGEEGEGGESTEAGGPSSPGGGGSGGERQGNAPQPRDDLVSLLERGDQAALQMALAEAARQANLNRIRLFTQRGMFTRRIMELMGLDGLNEEIERREQARNTDGAASLMQAREELRGQVRDYVEKQLEIFTANSGRQLREEVLSKMRLSNVDRSDMRIMRELVRKMAKRLIAMHSRRKKIARRGTLDVRRTIRANIEFDGLLFHTIWKRTKVDRPKVMAICDVSGSVAQVSRFLLMFLYSLQEVLPNVRSFAFSGDLGETTEMFEREKLEQALALVLRDFGGGSTDYGRAFEDFQSLAMNDIDHRTTVLILGDARSNYGDPRSDILKLVHARARRVIWLNPEPRSMWNSGDSEMRSLTPYCDRAITCASLQDLERVVSDLLRTAV